MKGILPGILFLFVFFSGEAQVYPRYGADTSRHELSNRKWRVVWQLETENGGMIQNDKQVKETLNDIYYNGINLRIGWQSEHGGDLYHQRYNYPIYGLGLYSSTFRKKEIGTPTALYGFVAIPIAPGRFRKWDFNYRISLGLASNFEPFDEVNNPNNVLLGSHRNVYVDLGIQANYKLGKRFQLGTGLAFHHFSNGSIKLPNRGINLVPLTFALTYHPARRSPDFSVDPDTKKERDVANHLHYSFGIKQFEPGGHRYFKSTIGYYRSRSFGYKWRLGLGADLFYSDSGRYPAVAGNNHNKLGALFSGGPAFYIDHVLTKQLYLNGNVGLYLNRNSYNGEVNPVFLRIGVRYKIFRKYYTGVSIKAHLGKADFVEWTVGRTWKRKGKW